MKSERFGEIKVPFKFHRNRLRFTHLSLTIGERDNRLTDGHTDSHT